MFWKQQPDSLTKAGLKFTIAILLFLITLILFIGSYMGLFNIVNALDVKAFYRYASDGKFDQDVYLQGAIKAETGLNDTLTSISPNSIGASFSREELRFLLKDQKLLEERLNGNPDYIVYLQKHDSTVSDVVYYMKKITSLDDIVLYAAMYIAALFYILNLYFLLKLRMSIFILSGLLYFILVVDSFMSGIFLDAFFPLIRNLNKLFNEGALKSYEDYRIFSKNFLPAIREAALTFIILDTVVQSIKDAKKRKLTSKFIAAYIELDLTLQFLNGMNIDLVVTRLNKLNLEAIEHFCKANKSDEHLKIAYDLIRNRSTTEENHKTTVAELKEMILKIKNEINNSTFVRENIII